MRLVDANVWLALTLSEHVHHQVARDWLDTVDEPDDIRLCRATQQSVLRLLTNRAVLGAYGNPPLTNAQAWDVVQAFLADDRIGMDAAEPTGVKEHWPTFALCNTASPKLWMDAYLAAFAYAAGRQLVTLDSDFRQFDGVDVHLLSS